MSDPIFPSIAAADGQRPHFVLLGAGASRAACPNGDANGSVLPLMADLVAVLGLEPLLERAGVSHQNRDFEAVYSELVARGDPSSGLEQLENEIRSYFSGLRLPEVPTLYDYIALSLCKRDVIATFNWDPFLVQACARSSRGSDSPVLLFLHGNTKVAVCPEHGAVGSPGQRCADCGVPLEPTPLLYPVAEKDYSSNPYIDYAWRRAEHELSAAFLFTIIGYGAPTSDAAAIRLLSQAWGPSSARDLEEIEIVDLVPEEVLHSRWDQFIHSHHYRTTARLQDTTLFQHPRRSCEAIWSELMELHSLPLDPPPLDLGLADLQRWYAERDERSRRV